MIEYVYVSIISTTRLLKYNFKYCHISCACIKIDLYYSSFHLRASRLTVKDIVELIHHVYLTMLNTQFEYG